MQIDLDQLAQLAKTFRDAEEMQPREQSRTPAERRADLEKWLTFAAQIEVAGGQYAEAAGKFRRQLAAELFVGKIAADTPFA